MKRIDSSGRNVTDLPGLWDESDTVITTMTPDEYCELQQKHGPNFAAWEVCSLMLDKWYERHPDEDRLTIDIIADAEFLKLFEDPVDSK